ncbi:MAG: tail fiber domain-containing protein [Verrucomicrobiota bacterium]
MKQLLLNRLVRSLLLLAFALTILSSHAAVTSPPQLLSYQGYLTDANGTPLGATNVGPKNYNVVFRVWDLQTGGTTGSSDELYAEQQTVTVNNGYFSVLLGQGLQFGSEPHPSPFSSVFFSTNLNPRYVEITVLGAGLNQANITILPRQQLLSAPYAFVAANAVTAASAASLVNNNNTTQVVTVTNGFVGIGTNSPATPLAVSGNTVLSGNLAVGGGANVASNLTVSGTASLLGGASVSSNLLISGAVGIGTASPGAPLDVLGQLQVNTNGTIESLGPRNSYQGLIESYYQANDRYGLGSLSNGIAALYTSSANPSSSLQFGLMAGASSFSPLMTVTHGGNVGIGTTTPSTTLEVNGVITMDSGAAMKNSTTIDAFNSAGTKENFLWPRWNDNSTYLNFGSNGFYIRNNSSGNVMSMLSNGFVGIGTASPTCPLDIENQSGSFCNPAVTYWYVSNNNGSGKTSYALCQGSSISLYAAGRVVSTEFDAVSDARVKEIVNRSDSFRDLEAVRQLKITDYRKIDRVQFGGRLEKGVIAQEVEKVVPEAVSTSTNFIPNIYAGAQSFACTNDRLTITLAKQHGMVTGDVVRLMTESNTVAAMVLAVSSPTTFSVALPTPAPKQVFVFGKQVGDFRTVNYDRLFTAGLGAIQELAKRTDSLDERETKLEARESRVAALEQKAAQVTALSAQVGELKAQLAAEQTQMADLKKLVVQLADTTKAAKLTARAAAAGPTSIITASLDR